MMIRIVLFALALVYAAALPLSAAPKPTKVRSYGPNGTHWPELIDTPFLYDETTPLIIEVACSWAAIKSALTSLTATQANAGVLIQVQPGTLVGNGSGNGSVAVIDTAGSSAWTKRVTVAPRDGYGSVSISGGAKLLKVKGVCFAGFIIGGGILHVGCDRSALAWSRSGYTKNISAAGHSVDRFEYAEVVSPTSQVISQDVSQAAPTGSPATNWKWSGCYFAPRYYIDNANPRPHTDTLQYYKDDNGGTTYWTDWFFTIEDTTLFASNNAALQTGGVGEITLDRLLAIGGSLGTSIFPVGAGGETEGIFPAINGGGILDHKWVIRDSLFYGSMAFSDGSTQVPLSLTPIYSVTNTKCSVAVNSFMVPQVGSWTIDSNQSTYTAAHTAITSEDLLTLWAEPDTPTKVAAVSFDPSTGSFDASQNVTLSTTTTGATIYYETGASLAATATPTTGSAVYSSPIAVAATTAIKAMATKAGLTNSDISSALITIAVAQPVIVPDSGSYAGAVEVSMSSATSGAAIRYEIGTTAGTTATPTASSQLYTAPLLFSAPIYIKARAFKSGLSDSSVAEAQIFVGDFIVSDGEWFTIDIPTYTAPFSLEFDIVTGAAITPMDAVAMLTPETTADAYTDGAAIARIGEQATTANWDARDGGSYTKDATVPNVLGVSQHVRFVCDPSSQTYSLWVDGTAVATDYAFRTDQSAATSITSLAFKTTDTEVTLAISNLISSLVEPPPQVGAAPAALLLLEH